MSKAVVTFKTASGSQYAVRYNHGEIAMKRVNSDTPVINNSVTDTAWRKDDTWIELVDWPVITVGQPVRFVMQNEAGQLVLRITTEVVE